MKSIHTQNDYNGEPIDGVYNPTREQKLAAGFRDPVDPPPVQDGYTRISATWTDDDGQRGKWVVVDRLTADIEAEAKAADLAANGVRYALQNRYLQMCDQLTGGTAHVKLGFAELEAVIKGLMATDPQTAMVLSVELLTLDAALKREGGLQWWDNCVWTEGLPQ